MTACLGNRVRCRVGWQQQYYARIIFSAPVAAAWLKHLCESLGTPLVSQSVDVIADAQPRGAALFWFFSWGA